ncbi:MAG: radical SAM protein [Candidatus Shapirobacteria bacterium]|nr:radical SAM protein [Candidatus Shapirobacteria bacterium]
MKKGLYSNRDLRLLVTQKCVYRCLFCHGEGLQALKKDGLKAEDFGYLFKIGKNNFGIKTVTLTGGEPLVRPDILEIAKCLKNSEANITLTTNGMLLEDNLEIGKYLDRVNVSFHVANKEIYEITVGKKDCYEKSLRGVKLLRANYPNLKIIINSTCVKGLNYSKPELENIIKLAEDLKASIKFVELFPPHSDGYVDLNEVSKTIIKLGFEKMNTEVRKLNYYNGKVNISLTKIFCAKAMECNDPSNFCHQYNDLFISPDGQIKPCRNNPLEINILKEIKNRDEEKLKNKIELSFNCLGKECSISPLIES